PPAGRGGSEIHAAAGIGQAEARAGRGTGHRPMFRLPLAGLHFDPAAPERVAMEGICPQDARALWRPDSDESSGRVGGVSGQELRVGAWQINPSPRTRFLFMRWLRKRRPAVRYSTVTLLARLRGLSTSQPRVTAM